MTDKIGDLFTIEDGPGEHSFTARLAWDKYKSGCFPKSYSADNDRWLAYGFLLSKYRAEIMQYIVEFYKEQEVLMAEQIKGDVRSASPLEVIDMRLYRIENTLRALEEKLGDKPQAGMRRH